MTALSRRLTSSALATKLVGRLDQISGQRVYIVAREIDQPKLSKTERSGTHKRMETTARRDVVCTIEVPFQFVQDRQK
jgi:hypothetical protein